MHLDRPTWIPSLAILLSIGAGLSACAVEADDPSGVAASPIARMAPPSEDVVAPSCPPGTVELSSCGGENALAGVAGIIAPPPLECSTDCVPVVDSCDPSATAGATLFSLSFAKLEDQQQYAVTIDASGNTILSGTTRDPLSGAYSVEVHAVSPAGVVLWSHTKATPSWTRTSVATDASGAVLVATAWGLLKLDAGGNALWWRAATAGTIHPPRVAVDGNGNVLYGGSFYNTFDLGLGPVTSKGGRDIYLAKLDATGKLLWNKQFGAADEQMLEEIAVGPSGAVALTGGFKKSVSFGGPTLYSGGVGAFLAELSANGAHLWSRALVGTAPVYAYGLGVDAAGNVVIGGVLNGSADFGGGTLSSAGSNDAFIAKFDHLGAHVWSQRFGDEHPQYVESLAVDPGGNIAIVGANMGFGEEDGDDGKPGIVDFGGGALVSHGGIDVVVAKFDAFGAHVYSKIFGGGTNEGSNSVAMGPDGSVAMAFDLNAQPVDFCLGPVSSIDPWDQVLVKFAP
ncbi:hypothetical protein [Polyangium aurulentum]|uniref:hypothetical protein n=1 Tax=Polyangium aurulentum TaxID=2567896 RepID=UPI0010ADF13D|nr:hypothetical protein [Polyangium aurulentum]UQA58734.1 PQQ-like beta-propeller repeat protein [Polyangium aurulentum]